MLYSRLEMQINSRILVQVGVSILTVLLLFVATYILLDVKQLQFVSSLDKYPGLERYNVVLSGTVSAVDDGLIEISKDNIKIDLLTGDSAQYAATEHNWDVLSPVAYDSSMVSVGEKVRVIGFIEEGNIVIDMIIHLDTQ